MEEYTKLNNKLKKYEKKLANCSFVDDAEMYNKKIIKYSREISYKFGNIVQQNGGESSDTTIYNNIMKEFINIDEGIGSVTTIHKLYNQLSESGKHKYGLIVHEGMKVFEN
jgi:hypothetical protein